MILSSFWSGIFFTLEEYKEFFWEFSHSINSFQSYFGLLAEAHFEKKSNFFRRNG